MHKESLTSIPTKMKRILIATFLGLILSINSIAQHKPSTEEWLACVHLSGHNFSNYHELNERIFQKFKIIYRNDKPKTLVFGSSRAFHLDSRSLNENHLVNHCMSGSTLEDIVALYALYEGREMRPKRIILGMDPWILNANNDQIRWRGLNDLYNQMVDFLLNKKKIINSIKMVDLREWFTIYSPPDFDFTSQDFDSTTVANITTLRFQNLSPLLVQDSIHLFANKLLRISYLYDTLIKHNNLQVTNTIQSLASETLPYRSVDFQRLTGYQKSNIAKLNRLLLVLLNNFPDRDILEAFPTLDTINDIGIYYKDGGVLYSKEFRNQDTAAVNLQALSVLNYSVINYTEFDKNKQQLFELFLNHLIKQKIEINFFLTPYHPKVYKVYSTDAKYKNILEFEKYIKKIAHESKNKITVMGSFNPQLYSLDATDFYDGMHPKEKGITKILTHLNFVH
jgi:hypothetical protein